MATPFSTACGVVVSNSYDTVGTLTRATLKALAPTEVQALFTDGSKWHEMTSMLRTQFEMRACGTKRYGMYDWIMSSNRPGMGKLIQTVKRDKGPSLIQPFILGRQNSIVNADYWVVTSGWPTAQGPGQYQAAVTGPLPSLSGGDRVIRVVAGYSVPLSTRYFLPGHILYHLNRANDGTAQHGSWKVIASAIATNESYVDILVADQNTFDRTTVDGEPATGIVLVGINNVQDVEKWCNNPLNVNPIKYVPYWYQTRRRVRRVDSQYEDVFQKLMQDNDWFEAFQNLTIAERNRQDELNDQKQFVNAFFFGRAISNAQVLEGSPNWASLTQVTSATGASVDPGTGSQLIAYKANMIGVYELLKACNQVKDIQNQTLNIKTFCETYMYDIYRARQSNGRPTAEVDVYTDSSSADEFLVAFLAYAKEKLGDIIRINIEEGANQELGFTWRKFKLFKPQGVVVNIIVNEFFDDILNTFTSLSTGSQASRGRFLAILDLGKGGSIYPAVLASNRKVYTTGELDKLAAIDASFACVMENPTIKSTLTSETTTAIVECPLHSLWIENFSGISWVDPNPTT